MDEGGVVGQEREQRRREVGPEFGQFGFDLVGWGVHHDAFETQKLYVARSALVSVARGGRNQQEQGYGEEKIRNRMPHGGKMTFGEWRNY